MSTTGRYKVHSWHINIDAGDCAIHLLVDEAATPKPQIRKAVLIDGGTGRKIQSIKNAIEEIEKAYTLSGTDPNLKFDSVIMTHWDIDHWEGIMDLLLDELEQKLVTNTDYKAAKTKSLLQFQKVILDKARIAYTSDADIALQYGILTKERRKGKTLKFFNESLDEAVREDCDYIKKLDASLITQSRYLRYTNKVATDLTVKEGATAPTVSVDDCLTKFYIPYMVNADIGWCGPFHATMNPTGGDDDDAEDEDATAAPKKRRRKGDTDATTSTKAKKKKAKPRLIAVFRTNADNSYNKVGRNTIAITAPIKYDLGIPWPVEGKRRAETVRQKVWRFNFVGELYDRAQEYLGADVFMAGPLRNKTAWRSLQNPAALVQAHVTAGTYTIGDGPRIFIIAADQRLIGNAPLMGDLHLASSFAVANHLGAPATPPTSGTKKELAFRPREKVIDGHVNHGFIFSPRKDNPKDKNSASIACLIMEGTGDNSGDGRLSFKIHHFLGGDALSDVEGGLVAWLKNNLNTANKQNWSCTSEAMKLSHHGGKESTQVGLLGQLAPNFIIASVPEGGDYAHPHAETLTYLDAAIAAVRFEDRKLVESKLPLRAGKYKWTDRFSPLLLTNYPGWFASDSKLNYSLDTFLSTLDEDKQFRADLTFMYDKSGTTPNIFTAFVAMYSNMAADAVTTLIATMTAAGRVADPKELAWVVKAARRKAIGILIEHRWQGLSPQPLALKPLAWKVVLGIDPAISSSEPPHELVLQDRTWWRLRDHKPAQQEANIPLPPPVTVKSVSAKRALNVVRAVAALTVARKKTIGQSPLRALWARIGEVPGDLEGEEPPVPTEPSTDDMPIELTQTANVHMQDALEETAHAKLARHEAKAANGQQSVAVLQPSIILASTIPSRFFVYSSIYENVDASNANELMLDPANPLDKFLSGMDPAYWVTDTIVSDSGSNLSADIPWVQALTSTSLNIGTLTLKAKSPIANQVADIVEISATITNADRVLSFSTASSYDMMQGGAGTGHGFQDAFYPGVLNPVVLDPISGDIQDMPFPEYNLLVLGLQSVVPVGTAGTPDTLKAAATFSLGDILRFFGPQWAADISELTGFDASLKFELNAGGQGSRNCLAFQAATSYPTWLRLQFDIPQGSLNDFKSDLQNRLSFLGSIDLTDASVICRKETRADRFVSNGQMSTSSRVSSFLCIQASVTVNNLKLRLILQYDTNGAPGLIIKFNEEKKSLGDALAWITNSLGVVGNPADLLPGSKNVYVRQIELKLGDPTDGGAFTFKGSTIALTLEVDIFGAAFFVVVTWPSFRLHAYLWTEVTAEADAKMLPWWEDYLDIEPQDPTSLDPMGPSLTNFLPSSMQDINIPQALDFRMTIADFEAWLDDQKQTNLVFKATLAPKEPATAGPSLDIDSLNFMAKRTTNGTTGETSYEIDISTLLYLLPRNFDPANLGSTSFYAAQVVADLDVSDGVWTVTAGAYNLNFATLYTLFSSNAADSVMDILEHFSIPRVEFEFVYEDKSFTLELSGALRISTFEIDIGYWYDSSDETWSFQGQLGFISDKAKITIADIVKDFDTSIADVLDDVEFIKDISVPAINKDATDFDSAPIQFYMTHTADAIILWFQIEIDSEIGAFTFLFAQYKSIPKRDAEGKLPPSRTPKRLLRVRLDQLPTLPNIPIVGSLGGGQPVDSISYVYVQDTEGVKSATNNASAGFTSEEIAAINGTLQDRNEIKFRDTKSNLPSSQASDSPTRPDYVMLHGHHFIVVTDGKVVLDHKFGDKPTGQQKPEEGTVVKGRTVTGPVVRVTTDTNSQVTEGDSGATVGQSKRSFPGIPITIENFGIQVKDKRLYLLIDATVMLGPIKLSLEGFGVGIPLAGISFADLQKPEVITQFDFMLTGIGVYFNAPPVMIAGCFFHIDTDEYEAYRGGLAVSILPYTLLAVGSYERTKVAPEFKSVFVYARLDGPLFTLEFAEISGVSAGFGYNYDLRLPTAAEIPDFPLVHGSEPEPDPMTLLSSRPTDRSSFVNWNTRKENSLWFAVGMKIDAFQILSVDAAAILSFSAEDVKIALVGIASASMPPSAGRAKPPEAFVYVELGIVASLDITGGSLFVGAQLTPNSYVLAPDCHLTGGFALCYWFGKNENAGDFVFTIGGYHPAFQKPKHYPDVPRLGISWNLSDVLTVRGESYFAVCPKACMGGGRLLATFNAGPIFASFEAWASFLINFKPFFFVADIGINVTVGCDIDLWIVHIHIEASLGAELHLQGPPFGGVAHVSFWVMGFSVYFGDQNNIPDPLPWKDFLPLIKQPGPGSDPNKTAMCVIAIEKGSADEKTTTTGRNTGDMWFVRAGSFQFRVETKFPLDSMDYGRAYKGPIAKTERIYGRPMQLENPYTSTLKVLITAPGTEADPNPWLVQPLIRSVPKALWAKYSRDEDPVYSGNNIGTLLSSTASGSTIDHLVGFTFRSPDPKLPSWSFPEFDALAAMQEGVFQDGVTDPSVKPVRRNALLGPATSADERPVLKPTPSPQTADLPIDKKPDVWVDDQTLKDGGYWDTGQSFDEIESVWGSVDEEATQFVADVYGDVMAWWGPGVPGGAVSSLSGKKPNWLMGSQDRFETFYLEAPWLTKEVVVPPPSDTVDAAA